jgi:hypothetical protein
LAGATRQTHATTIAAARTLNNAEIGRERETNLRRCVEIRWNPPNGSWGIVKAQPTPQATSFLNPPNGSWGIVKAQPSSVGSPKGLTLTIPQLPLGGFAAVPAAFCRLGFNDPPTAVGGIRWTENFKTPSMEFPFVPFIPFVPHSLFASLHCVF